jgi:hypothetical protein
MTGIYLNNSFLTTGQSGFLGVDYKKGCVYFSNAVTGVLSGNYSIRDYNFDTTNDSETTLLFETKQYLKPKVGQYRTGIFNEERTYPIIYVRDNGGENVPFSFGGLKETNYNIRLVVLADSEFLLDATSSLIRDIYQKYIALFQPSEMPFNSLGSLKSGVFNYTGMADRTKQLFVNESYVSKLNQNVKSDASALNSSNIWVGFSDISLIEQRYT